MYQYSISRLVTFVVFLLFSFTFLYGQQRHFIYFQHEQLAPFYLKYQGQIYRSSAQGYLILSKLQKGEHQLFLGLDSGNAPVKFILTDIDSDKGYLIKNFDASGWALFDLQHSAVVYAAKEEGQKDVRSGTDSSQNDRFSEMLSNVIKDSSVKYVNAAPVHIKKEGNTVLGDRSVSDSLMKNDSSSIAVNIDSAGSIAKRSVIISYKKEYDSTSIDYDFIVKEKNYEDTVSVLIETRPSGIVSIRDLMKVDKGSFLDWNISKRAGVLIEAREDDLRTLALKDSIAAQASNTVPVLGDTIQIISDDSVLLRKNGLDTLSSGNKYEKNICRKVAWEDDFISLRQAMAGQRNEDSMIIEAEKVFSQMCFSTSQIAQLSVLLSADEKKFLFFSAALKHILDIEQFSSLGDLIKDAEYRKRFDALMQNK